jgi:hypothetical protein
MHAPAPCRPDDGHPLDAPYCLAMAARARGDAEAERNHWRELERILTVPAEGARWV